MTDNATNMNQYEPAAGSARKKRLAGAVALLLAGGIAGGAIAATSSASAAGTSTAPAATAPAPAAGHPGGRVDSATPVRAGEKAVTGTVLATLKAAALKAVPGGTVYRVETDVDGATYEAHMTKADGAQVTVKFGKDFAVTAIQAGMGAGGPGGPMGPGGPGGRAPAASNGSGI